MTTLFNPVSPYLSGKKDSVKISTLLFKDGEAHQGISFGAERSVAGECVFQTGMVGYPESLTDPSYEGQILVLTFPLIGNYGVPARDELEKSLGDLPKYFESNRIHITALVVGQYSHDYSHFLATSSLATWLKENNIPAIYGIDTRSLTKKIRDNGSTLAKLLFPAKVGDKATSTPEETVKFPWISSFSNLPWHDPNSENLVAKVSCKEPKLYKTTEADNAVKGPDGKTLKILALDVGMKNNQIRCFLKRGVDVKVVPWDYDFLKDNDYDGLFISNGPGDPTMVQVTIDRLSKLLKMASKPIFGICLGHQLIALASGAKTLKMKFGNRGHNIPCTDMHTGRCYITSQNHGYAVDCKTLAPGWEEYFVNGNDGSNEGIIHTSLPYYSVQFHPESTPGPLDTEFLFDKFIASCLDCKKNNKLVPLVKAVRPPPPTRHHPRKVLILGSGGLSIGQAGEFDYSGSQAIKALKEENIYTVLINPNIATIQTSKGLADKVYFLPVNPEFVRKVIKHEKPDGIYVTFGGQTALNVGVKMKDEFTELGVKVLGTPIHTIEMTEDRELFARAMEKIGEKCAKSTSANNMAEAIAAGKEIGYPLIIRAAYALGGLGSGFAQNEKELIELCTRSFAASPQVLVEKSMKGWKEIEYEVVRDACDNCITVCNMENFDPLGIHTGDSIVVAPSQTLSDDDYMMLRRTAVNVIRSLGVVGECNIQYALNPNSKEYCIIEVNARLSRSSALASKATGYPLAFVAAKLGLGIPLTEVKNNVTKKTIACFEPSLDYVVVKIPRWDLKKFNRVSTKISSQMKSVGEVMAIGRTFEETIQKAIRSVDYHLNGFSEYEYAVGKNLDEELRNPSDERLFAIATALHKGYTIDKLFELTNIDRWFLNKLKNIVELNKELTEYTPHNIPKDRLMAAKQFGFSDRQIGIALGTSELAARKIRTDLGIIPFVKQIDTVAAEFPCYTNYLYMTYNANQHDITFEEKGVMVLGSGVYRIGSSVEFDWCAVKCIRSLREMKLKTIMVNYNPETVSTDYDEADRLYFENLTLEKIMDIYEVEQSRGVIVSMGGQTPNNVALPLHRENVKILGTSPEQIDTAENRYKFSRLVDKIGVDQPLWKELTSFEEAKAFCEKVSFPVLVRPSYVLSGAAMNVVYSLDDLENYLSLAVTVSREYPVVISKYIEEAKEIELDAVALEGKLLYHVISEHVENAGVHSGDATLILPPQDLDPETVRKIETATRKLAFALNITGPMNIQFLAKNNDIKIIECNVRASRSFPFCSKVLGVDLIEMATKAIVGLPVESYPKVDERENYVAVKVPQFSFSRLVGADPILGVDMASTGEVACFGKNKYEAYLKALISTGFKLPEKNILISIGSFKEKQEFLPSVQKLHAMGYKLFATSGTADFISEHNVPVKYLETLDNDTSERREYSVSQHLANNLIDLYINLPSKNQFRRPASYMSRGYRSRRMAVDFSVPLITNIKCAKLFVEALTHNFKFEISSNDFQSSHNTVVLPGLINIQSFVPKICSSGNNSFEKVSKASIAGGFTISCVVPYDVINQATFNVAQKNLSENAFCDFTLGVTAAKENSTKFGNLNQEASFLYLPFDASSDFKLSNIRELSNHLKSWPTDSLIVADAKDSNLASVLLLASLHNRSIHVTNVTTKDEIELIVLNKEHGGKVTCDVSIYNLFLSKDEVKSTSLGLNSDVEGLWSNVSNIDCFSIGKVPHNVAVSAGKDPSLEFGFEDALPLLLSVAEERNLTITDIIDRFYHNPKTIFKLPEQKDTYIEVETDRKRLVPAIGFENANAEWSPFAGKVLKGCVHRVVLKGETVYLDGAFFGKKFGADVFSNVPKPVVTSVKAATVHFEKDYPKSPRHPGSITNLQYEPVKNVIELPNLMRSSTAADQEEVNVQTGVAEISRQGYIAEVPISISSLVSRSPFYRKHVLSVQQFSRSDLHVLFGVAQELRTIVDRQGSVDLLKGKVMCAAFYEPSTRTSSSFQAAMLRLGGSVVSINESSSSVAKGETLPDTVRTLQAYGDIIVLRHPQPGSSNVAAKYSSVPIINAGDGIGEHPTQAFLDIFTIREELGTVNGLTITIVGDLKNGRTVHSLVKLLALYDVKLNYVSPETLKMPHEIKEKLNLLGVKQNEYNNLDDVIGISDVVYVTRIQKERFSNLDDYERVKGTFIITNKLLQRAKRHMIVMHPLPRVNEIDYEVDFDQRAAYFRQMKYGLFVRMALLALVCGRSN
ncbi:hypothetical protein HDU92_002718 [Lobulomyces angularis]|nr:hypothetical protein HDU92_002718 [Lobulomyces angularis]